jgi:steroid delta-isomerase-like uncharacterized protein
MTRTEIAALLDRWLDAVARRDVDALMDLYAANSLLESPMAGPGRGRDAVARAYETFFAAFPDLKLDAEEPLIDGDRVARVATVTGTDVGGFMGLEPTGKPFRFPVVLLYTVRDGRIVQERRLYDFTGLLLQIGALKAKPA